MVLKAGHSNCHHKVARFHTPITQNYIPSSQKASRASLQEGGRMWDSSVPALMLPHLYHSSSLLCWIQTPQPRHPKPGTKVQGCLCSRCACRVLFTLLHIAIFHIIHHQHQGMLQKRLSPSYKGKQTYPYRAGTSMMHVYIDLN